MGKPPSLLFVICVVTFRVSLQAINASMKTTLLGFGVTDVARGENAGRKLTHDFVVLAHHQSPLQGSSPRTESKPEENSGGPDSRALAAWVSIGSDPTPIQATGGWLCLQH